MKTIDSVKDMQHQSLAWRQQGEVIGFVPTMGNLHQGHLALVDKARKQADRVVVSIFVNPLQFNDKQDFERYPRTLEADLNQLEEGGVDAVFMPSENALYPSGRENITRVDVPQLSGILEGASRPGHFAGVATIVSKLFNIVLPDVAMFGEKDFQQLLLIQQMVRDLDIPVRVVPVETLREPGGLAMSSRNNLLDDEQREKAATIYQVLQGFREALLKGEGNIATLEQAATEQLRQAGFIPDYVLLRDAANLLPVSETTRERVILAAAQLGKIRLIDNIRV